MTPADDLTPLTRRQEQALEALSPFELKARLLAMANSARLQHRGALLDAEMCAGCAPVVPFDLFAVEGGTAAMCYVFDSLAANYLLRPGDTVALMVPAFTPYLEIPRLDRYGYEIVELRADACESDGTH